MKYASLILSFYTLFLIALPTLQTINFSTTSECCEGQCDASQDQDTPLNNTNSCNDICNPFISCHCCLGFTADNLIKLIPLTKIISNNFFTPFKELALLSFSIWQPPKLS